MSILPKTITDIPVNRMEEEADIFAMAFLMPSDRFQRVVDENTESGRCDIHKVAEIFGVEPLVARQWGVILKVFE